MQASWRSFLEFQQGQPYYKDLQNTLATRRAQGEVIFPEAQDVFRAFDLTPLPNVKVVILGQDPYHGAGQAHGLAFSVKSGVAIPPSLRNIFKELNEEFSDYQPPMDGDLSNWAEQGVLLLNTVLTVSENQANSHSDIGWQHLTHAAIEYVNAHCTNVVFMLWGAQAQKLTPLIDATKHCVLKSPHPSPLSAHRGFFGCRHFLLANQWLEKKKLTPINW